MGSGCFVIAREECHMAWTVSRRVITGFAIGLALVVAVAGLGVGSLTSAAAGWREALARERRTLVPALETQSTFRRANLDYLRYLLKPAIGYARSRDSVLAETRVLLEGLRDSSVTAESRGNWTDVLAHLERWDVIVRTSMAAAESSRRDEALRLRDTRATPAQDSIRDGIQRGVVLAQQRTDAAVQASEAATGRARTGLLVGALLALLVGVASAVLLNRAVSGPLRETTGVLASSAAEILAAMTQQASGASESSAAVAETVTTVDEVAQTAQQASERAREIERTSRKALDESNAAMTVMKDRVEAVAESILALAEQAQAVGEIIATVTDIAEQINLLALNAAVEAARVGEQGRGFAVVAAQVRSLAEQSKKATVEIRRILGEIQRATGAAVMTTEQGTKQVAAATQQVTEVIGSAAQAAAQIVASAGQQAAGMTQIRQAMANIQEATQQNVVSASQAERAARDLDALGGRLLELVGGHRKRAAATREAAFPS
jgi:CHASE3 domain sensor protein